MTGRIRLGDPVKRSPRRLKQICRICNQPIRAGRTREHRDCERAAEAALDQATTPTPTKGANR